MYILLIFLIGIVSCIILVVLVIFSSRRKMYNRIHNTIVDIGNMVHEVRHETPQDFSLYTSRDGDIGDYDFSVNNLKFTKRTFYPSKVRGELITFYRVSLPEGLLLEILDLNNEKDVRVTVIFQKELSMHAAPKKRDKKILNEITTGIDRALELRSLSSTS